jgi:response regulator RpfG family c-di-GMP phosphodiesterase
MEHPNRESDPAAATQAPATLLFVDDEPSILSALRRLFRPTGHRVLTAESGSAGLEILQREAVQLVISDMRMPQMDGSEFLERARAIQPRATRILLTGYADVGSTIEAINRGETFRCIAKPWDDKDILLVVRHALERRALERENARLLDLTRRQNADLQKLNAGLEDQVAERTAAMKDALRELEQTRGALKKTFLTTVRVLATPFSQLTGPQRGWCGTTTRTTTAAATRIAWRGRISPLAPAWPLPRTTIRACSRHCAACSRSPPAFGTAAPSRSPSNPSPNPARR